MDGSNRSSITQQAAEDDGTDSDCDSIIIARVAKRRRQEVARLDPGVIQSLLSDINELNGVSIASDIDQQELATQLESLLDKHLKKAANAKLSTRERRHAWEVAEQITHAIDLAMGNVDDPPRRKRRRPAEAPLPTVREETETTSQTMLDEAVEAASTNILPVHPVMASATSSQTKQVVNGSTRSDASSSSGRRIELPVHPAMSGILPLTTNISTGSSSVGPSVSTVDLDGTNSKTHTSNAVDPPTLNNPCHAITSQITTTRTASTDGTATTNTSKGTTVDVPWMGTHPRPSNGKNGLNSVGELAREENTQTSTAVVPGPTRHLGTPATTAVVPESVAKACSTKNVSGSDFTANGSRGYNIQKKTATRITTQSLSAASVATAVITHGSLNSIQSNKGPPVEPVTGKNDGIPPGDAPKYERRSPTASKQWQLVSQAPGNASKECSRFVQLPGTAPRLPSSAPPASSGGGRFGIAPPPDSSYPTPNQSSLRPSSDSGHDCLPSSTHGQSQGSRPTKESTALVPLNGKHGTTNEKQSIVDEIPRFETHLTTLLFPSDQKANGHVTQYSCFRTPRPPSTVTFYAEIPHESLQRTSFNRFARWEPYWQVCEVVSFGMTSKVAECKFQARPQTKAQYPPGTAGCFTVNRSLIKKAVEEKKLSYRKQGDPVEGEYKLLLRMLPVKYTASPKSLRADCHSWPKGTFLQIRGGSKSALPRILDQRKQSNVDGTKWESPTMRPLDVTGDLTKQTVVNAEKNSIEMSCYDEEQYVLFLALCQYRSPASLSRQLQSNDSKVLTRLTTAQSLSKARQMMTEVVLDDFGGSAASQEKLKSVSFTLRDQFTMGVIKTPVRGRKCSHFSVSAVAMIMLSSQCNFFFGLSDLSFLPPVLRFGFLLDGF